MAIIPEQSGATLAARVTNVDGRASALEDHTSGWVNVKSYGAVGDGVTDDTVAVQAAIAACRRYPEERLDTIGGNTITMYRSGVVFFPPGIYQVSPDAINITADMGLTLRGFGSRRSTNAIRAASTLLIHGSSSGYGIRIYRGGARSLHIEDLDVTYDDPGFNGHLIDMMDAPGLKLRRAFLGTHGITGPTRLQTAASLLRVTYDEFVTAEDCTLDGAVVGVLFDNDRTELENPMGGWGASILRCTFYDFTGSMIATSSGARTVAALVVQGNHFNPISVDCARAVDLENIDALDMTGNMFTPSTEHKPSTEWLRLVNVTGAVQANVFGDLSKAGTIGGNLWVTGNVFAGTDGFTLASGVIAGKANEFSTGSSGFTLVPAASLAVDLGPDAFKGDVNASYYVPSGSAYLSGRINYDAAADVSDSRFYNVDRRIAIENIDRKSFTVSDASYTVSVFDTGRTVLATGAAPQTFTLPSPVNRQGTRLTIAKLSDQTLTINAAASTYLYAGSGGVKTSVSAAGEDVGGTLVLEAWEDGWRVVSQVGTWTY